MRYARYFLPLLAVGTLEAQAYVQWNRPTMTPGYPACSVIGNTVIQATQTFAQPYTIECVSGLNHVGVGAGSVSATGQGGCRGINGGACQASQQTGGPAPTFSPFYNQSGAYFNIWINVDSVPVQGPDNYGSYFCGAETVSASPSPPKQVPIPRCPYTPPPPSPIVIDPTGEGFWLTDNQHGVQFRQQSASPLQQMSWTDPAHHNAWLVRPNPDGSVTSLADNMFGNLTPQAPSIHPNGYLALAYLMEQEGCAKGLSRLDSTNCPAVWNELRLWQDANQDGVAQPGELHTLTDLGVYAISLQFHESSHTDQYGNIFRYVAHIWDAEGVDKDNRCYDVFLLLQ